MRVGLHSGLSEEDVVHGKDKTHPQYVGRALTMAKALCDCGHGGMVLLSEACYGALVPSSGLASYGHILHLGDYQFAAPGTATSAVYWAVAPEMQPRVPLLLRRPLRQALQAEVGAPQAPAGHVAVAFVDVVGGSTLTAWDAGVAGRAFDLLHSHARHLLGHPDVVCGGATPGYAVKMREGLCLCSFASPRSALLWAACLVNDLRLSDQWEAALLAHPLCEEVALDVSGFAVPYGVSEEPPADTSAVTGQEENNGRQTTRPDRLSEARKRSSVARSSTAAAQARGEHPPLAHT